MKLYKKVGLSEKYMFEIWEWSFWRVIHEFALTLELKSRDTNRVLEGSDRIQLTSKSVGPVTDQMQIYIRINILRIRFHLTRRILVCLQTSDTSKLNFDSVTRISLSKRGKHCISNLIQVIRKKWPNNLYLFPFDEFIRQ